MGLRVDWIGDEAGFAQVAPAWDRLAAGLDVPFLHHGWLTAWWTAFGAGRSLAVCTVWDGDDLVAALPCAATRTGGLHAMANDHTPTFRPLGSDPAALHALATAVLRRSRRVTVANLPEDDPLAGILRGASPRRLVAAEDGYRSPTVELTGDFAAFRAATKSRWGAPLERFRRKMQREHEAEFSLVERPAALEDELREGFTVEASGWKGEAGTAILSSPETRTFYHAVSHALAANDQLRLSILRFDGVMVGFDLLALHAGRLHLLKTGFDEAHRKLAPGLVLRLSVIERCFELGLQTHELGGGPDPWKLKFATNERRHVNLYAFGRRPTGAAGYAYRRTVRPLLRDAAHRYRAARK